MPPRPAKPVLAPTQIKGDLYFVTFEWRGKHRRRYLLKTHCSQCGKTMFKERSNVRKHPQYRAMCSKKCQYDAHRGPNNVNWGGGRKYKRGSKGGHILAYAPDHPNARQNFVPEHRLVVEEDLGRYLEPSELVHHIDCDPENNERKNLIVLNMRQHQLAHGSLESCVQLLIHKKALKFNTNTLRYEPV